MINVDLVEIVCDLLNEIEDCSTVIRITQSNIVVDIGDKTFCRGNYADDESFIEDIEEEVALSRVYEVEIEVTGKYYVGISGADDIRHACDKAYEDFYDRHYDELSSIFDIVEIDTQTL